MRLGSQKTYQRRIVPIVLRGTASARLVFVFPARTACRRTVSRAHCARSGVDSEATLRDRQSTIRLPPSRRPPSRWSSCSAVIAILGVLVALLLPAVQASRESSAASIVPEQSAANRRGAESFSRSKASLSRWLHGCTRTPSDPPGTTLGKLPGQFICFPTSSKKASGNCSTTTNRFNSSRQSRSGAHGHSDLSLPLDRRHSRSDPARQPATSTATANGIPATIWPTSTTAACSAGRIRALPLGNGTMIYERADPPAANSRWLIANHHRRRRHRPRRRRPAAWNLGRRAKHFRRDQADQPLAKQRTMERPPGGVNVIFCDGGVRFLSENMQNDVLFALCTRDGQEIIPSDAF